MATWDIGGVWNGEYEYDPDPARPMQRSPVAFTLVARRGWFGRFTGTIQDDARTGIPCQAVVSGRISGLRIVFAKQYPEWHLLAPDGRHVTLRDRLATTHNLPLDEDIPPPPIQYTGRYDPSLRIVVGAWRIEAAQVGVRSGGRTYTVRTAGLSGSWSMRRQAM